MKQLLQPAEVDAGSVLAHLRDTIPLVQVRLSSAATMAERMASDLLALYDVTAAPVSSAIILDLPKIAATVDATLPSLTSGLSVWDSRLGSWVIRLNGAEPATRQRFTLFHEFFHIVVHRHVHNHGLFDELTNGQVEYIADYFAGCVLVPKQLLKRAWGSGVQQPAALGQLFNVSPQAIAVRLKQVGLAVADDLAGSHSEGVSR